MGRPPGRRCGRCHVPITYMNSSAAIKAFTGEHGGAVCTSSNAERALRWAFERGEKVLFLPDQHLGRNTAVLQLGLSLDDCVVFNPHKRDGGLTPGTAAQRDDDPVAGPLLGARAVHRGERGRHPQPRARRQRPRPSRVPPRGRARRRPRRLDRVHHQTLDAAPAGSTWAIGTELNLVRRLAARHPDKRVIFLEKTVCYCSTMNRIDLPHLVRSLESLTRGEVVNRITVEPRGGRVRPPRARPDAGRGRRRAGAVRAVSGLREAVPPREARRHRGRGTPRPTTWTSPRARAARRRSGATRRAAAVRSRLRRRARRRTPGNGSSPRSRSRRGPRHSARPRTRRRAAGRAQARRPVGAPPPRPGQDPQARPRLRRLPPHGQQLPAVAVPDHGRRA